MTVSADPAGTLRLEGQVVNSNSMGVANAHVSINSTPERHLRTEQDGSFVFDELLPRKYVLLARNDHAVARSAPFLLSGTSEPIILRLRKGGLISIRVTDMESTLALSNARIETINTLSVSAKTDEEGHAKLEPLPSFLVDVLVSLDGYAPTIQTIAVTPPGAMPQRASVRLVRGVAVHGRVLSEDGHPLPGVLVEWGRQHTAVLIPGATTGPDGAWSIPALGSGQFRFRIQHEEYQSATFSTAIAAKNPPAEIVTTLIHGLTLSGRVTRDDIPAPTATVRIAINNQGESPTIRAARVDHNGLFVVKGLPSRKLQILALDDDGSSETLSISPVDGKYPQAEIKLSTGGSISGTVRYSDGEPIPEAQIVAIHSDWKEMNSPALALAGTISSTANSGGGFKLTGLEARQRYIIRATHPGAPLSSAWKLNGVDSSVVSVQPPSCNGELLMSQRLDEPQHS